MSAQNSLVTSEIFFLSKIQGAKSIINGTTKSLTKLVLLKENSAK